MPEFSRRTLLQASLAAGALPLAAQQSDARPDRFRFVHFTDSHLQPDRGAADGIAQAVRKVLSLKPRPAFVITGGDHISGGMALPRAQAEAHFQQINELLKPLEMPVHYTIGNHDIYGWAAQNPATAQEPEYGKKMFQERVSRSAAYRSFDFGRWRFIILDSVQPTQPGPYRGEIDDTQLQWLKNDLARVGTKRPIVLITHIPILTLYNQYVEGTTRPTPENMIVRNGKEVRDLFKDYAVKAVLQGHTHVTENCFYAGTQYITSGAVCGSWWQGPRLGVDPEGFSVCDVNGDRLSWQYVSYGWKVRE